MKRIFRSKPLLTLGLMAMLTSIAGAGMVQTAQAQVAQQSGSACSTAYFEDPGFMYSPVTEAQRDAVERFMQDPARLRRGERLISQITRFSVPLDSPLGYVVNKVNGREVSIPPQIAEEIRQEVYGRGESPDNRKRMAELNQKYGQYATFGQNIILLPSPEQIQEGAQSSYELLAYIKSLMTPQQRQKQRAALTAQRLCPRSALFRPEMWRQLSIDAGTRPDLDARLRNDTSGTTLFE